MRIVALIVVALVACGKDSSPKGLCTRGCKKALSCIPNGESQLDECIASCMPSPPDKDKVDKLEAASCAEVEGILRGGGGGGAAAPAAPAGGNPGCTADCRGCVGDNSSCYAAAGGANGIPCDPCCCAPGGPAPTWKTEE